MEDDDDDDDEKNKDFDNPEFRCSTVNLTKDR